MDGAVFRCRRVASLGGGAGQRPGLEMCRRDGSRADFGSAGGRASMLFRGLRYSMCASIAPTAAAASAHPLVAASL